MAATVEPTITIMAKTFSWGATVKWAGPARRGDPAHKLRLGGF
jgi:hypothetical protein